jgi:predicted anti-sigma-YlaC factor YlaD
MQCSHARQALSAYLDGVDPPVSRAAVDAHVADCPPCRAWRDAAEDLRRRSRLGRPLPDPDLADRIMSSVAADRKRRRARHQWLVAAVLVALCGSVQLLVSVPLLVMTHHRAHRSTGDWLVGLELAVAVSFVLGALVLLWHLKGDPVEPAVPLAAAPDIAASEPDEGAA